MFNFGKEHPNAERGASDTVNTAGTIIGDIGGVGATLGNMGKNMGAAGAGSGGAFVGNFLLGASELAQGNIGGGLGDLGASAMNAVGMMNPEMAAEMPGLGVAAGAMQFLGHGAEALRHTDEIDGGYQNNQFWTEGGNATLGALNAAAALDPTGISSLYVGGGQLLLDGLGSLSGAVLGEDYRFSAGSAIGGAEHLLFDTGQAIGSGLSSAYDTVSSWF